jgi:tartrate dehydrogenase/decarboxylase / D-malate dehydrogenase
VTTHRIAVIPGDGIGTEVVPAGLEALGATAERFGLRLEFDSFDFASADYWQRHGTMLPPDWEETLRRYDAIYFGAVGWPAVVPDHVSLWGSLLQFRRTFDQYVNLRPCRLMPGVRSPLAGREPGDIDFIVVRENTEGEYSSVGGRIFEGTERETVLQETVMTRIGVDRVLRFAFEQARRRPKQHLTSATKSNGISISMPYWDERVVAMGEQFPGVRVDKFHIDALAAQFVLRPEWFDVVVASNLFGDILSDLGPACTGTLGIAPSANINPGRPPELVRAGARLGAGHRRPGHRQPGRPDLVRLDDAGAPGPSRCGRAPARCDRERPGARPPGRAADPGPAGHRDDGGTGPGDRRARPRRLTRIAPARAASARCRRYLPAGRLVVMARRGARPPGEVGPCIR